MYLSEFARFTKGRLVGADVAAGHVVTDSRQLQSGDLFVALKGEHFDAHDFLEQAAANGAVAALVEAPTEAFDSYILVDDCRHALGLLAAGWYQQFSPRTVAVTGNAGKTSVKEMIAALLGEQTLATLGNLNNEIGVPLTLLRATAEQQFAVIELGANHLGEIAWTASLVKPQVVLVTNVTGAHLEGFGSLQGIANAKAEIFTAATEGATAIINLDDDFADFFSARARKAGLNIVTVSARAPADVSATDWREDTHGGHFTLHWQDKSWPVSVSWPGKHQMINALQALAAVQALGVAIDARLPALTRLPQVPHRMVKHACGGGLLVDDCYNANPGSVKVAAEWLATQPAPRLFVLGGVAELGPTEADLHRQMGIDMRACGIEQLVTIGELAAPAAAAFGADATSVSDYVDAVPWARTMLQQGGSVLVKGSRSARLERLVDALLQEHSHNTNKTSEETH